MHQVLDALDAVRVLTRKYLGQLEMIDAVERVIAHHTAHDVFVVLTSESFSNEFLERFFKQTKQKTG